SLVRDGEPTLAPGYYVGGYASGHPVMLPMIDVVEVGAGGGSIAWIDDIGALKVGPHSAGADPGPICYRGGGTEPTITDANVVLGRLDPKNFLGGTMELDADGARHGVADKIAKPLSMDPLAAAQAILEIAVSKMSLAVREVSVEKGYDPRDFVLVASGGGGPPHAVAIARELFIPTVIIPRFPAHFSAVGMLMADERHDLVSTYLAELGAADFGLIRQITEELTAEAYKLLGRTENVACQVLFDLRYVGQEFTLPCRSAATISPRPTARRSAPPSMRCTSSVMRITPATSRWRSSTSASSRSGIARSWRCRRSPARASSRRARPVPSCSIRAARSIARSMIARS